MTPDEPSESSETASPPDPDAPSAPPSRRRLPRWLLPVSAVLIVVVIGLVIAQARLTRMASRSIQSALSAELGVPVRIDGLAIRFFPSAVVLQQVQIGGADREPAPLLTAASVEIRFSLLSLLAERLVVHRIDLDTPQVALTRDRIDHMTQSPGSSVKTGAVIVREIAIRNGTVRYVDPSRTLDAVVEHLDATVDIALLAEQATVNLTQGNGTLEHGEQRHTFASISGRVTWTPSRLTLKQLRVDGPEGRLGLDGTVALDAAHALQLTLAASGPLERLAPWLPSDHRWEGQLNLEAAISGPWTMGAEPWRVLAPLFIDGRLEIARLTLDALPIGAATAQWQFRQGRLVLSRLTGAILGGSIDGHAAVSLPPAPPAVEAAVTLSGVKAVPVLRRWLPDVALPDGRINGRLSVRGHGWTMAALNGEGQIEYAAADGAHPPAPSTDEASSPIREAWRRVARIAVDGQWHADRWSLQRLDLASLQGNRLSLQGSAEYDGPLALTGAWQLVRLDEIGEWAAAGGIDGLQGWMGAIDGQVAVTGQWDHPHLTGSVSARGLGRHDESLDDAHVSFSFDDHTLTLRDGLIREQGGQVVVAGTVTLAHDRPGVTPSNRTGPVSHMHLSMTVTDGALGRILRFAGADIPIDGKAGGSLELRGSTDDFHLRGPVHVAEGRLFGEPIASSDATIDVTGDGVTLSKVVLADGGAVVRGSGRVGFDDTYQTDLTFESLPLGRLPGLQTAGPRLSGTLSGSLSGSGTWAEPHAEARIEFHALAAGASALGHGGATLRLAGTQLEVALTLDDPHLTVDGTVRLVDDFPATLHLRVDRFPFALLLRPFIPAWPEQMTLTASGEGALAGGLLHPAALDGRLSVSALEARIASYPLVNDGPVELEMRHGRLTAQRVRFTGEGTTLAAEGSLTLAERYDLFIHGEAELAILRLFIPGITYGKGTAYLALQITDRWRAPSMAGGISIQNGLLRLEAVDQPLTVSNASLVFNGQQLVLDNLHGGIGKGTVEASGLVGLRGLRPAQYRVLMEVAGMPIAPMEGLSGVVEGSLWLQGEFPGPDGGPPVHHQLKGDLHLIQATYAKRIDLKTILKEQPAFDPVTLSLPAFLNDVVLQIHLWGRRAIWIRNNIAALPLDIDLEARGTVEHPVIVGRIFTTDGTFTFLHTQFQVSQGSIDFLDPKQTRPVIDLKASASVRNYEIDLALTGTPERIDLMLSSDPVLSQADILSVMTVGRTSEEVDTAGAGSVATSEAAALVVSELLEEPAQQFGLDRFQIDSAVDRTGLTVGPQLTVGKELFDRRLLFLYSQPLDPTTLPLYRVEYQFNRHISLIGEGDDSGRLGGDVKFRFDFR